MIVWLDLGVIQCYRSDAAIPHLDTSRRRARILIDPGNLPGSLSGEASSVVLNLSDPQLVAPLLPVLTATLHTIDEHGRQDSFTGSVVRVTIDSQVAIQIDA